MAGSSALAVSPMKDDENAKSTFPPDRMNCAYRIVQSFSSLSTNLFFGDIDIVGLENIPDTGPVILVGNHKNQFVDAMMVTSLVTSRKVAFLVAEKSMHRRFIGDSARVMDAIPVIRPQDRARHAPGIITGFDASKNRLLGSSDCAFATNVKKGEMIILHGIHNVAPLVILEVVSDTSVIVKPPVKPEDEPDGTGGQATTLTVPESGVSFKVIPKIDQSEVFKKVHDALCEGRCIGIFPEGGSSDRTDLLPLKVGVAIMALGAAARGAPVKLIPFGINYSDGNKWRSKVFVDVGKPMVLSDALIERYRMGAQREAQGELLKEIEVALRGVTFNAPDKHTLNILRTMRRLYQGPVKLPARRFMELNRRFALAFGKFRDDERFLDLVARVHDYMLKLQSLGVVDRQVAALPPLGSLSVTLRSFCAIIFILLFSGFVVVTSIPGNIIYTPLLIRVRYVAKSEAERALAGSRVKVKGADVEASQKILSAFIWTPVTIVATTCVAVGLTVGLWPRVSPYEPGTTVDWFYVNAIWLIPLGVFILTPILGIYNTFAIDVMLKYWYWIPYHLLIVASQCRPNSAGARIRIRRKALAIRIQEFYEKIIAPSFPEWGEDIIISHDVLLSKRRKSDHVHAVQVAEEIDEIAKEISMPDSPSLPGSRKTISELKSSMIRMQENVSRFEPSLTPPEGSVSPRYMRQQSMGLATTPDDMA